MMVKFSILLIPISCIHCVVFAQPRHVQGLSMVGIYAGYGKDTKLLGASLQKYITGDISVKLNGAVNWVYFKLTDYHSFFFHPEVHYTLLSNKRQLYFNANGGFKAGLEYLNSKVFYQKINNIYVGESIGMDMEYFLSSHVKIDLAFEQQFLQRSKISDYQYYFKLGTYVEL